MTRTRPVCYQLNLQTQLGGGEIYTRFFCRALIAAGWQVQLLVSPLASFWRDFGLDDVKFTTIRTERDVLEALPPSGALLVTQSGMGERLAKALAGRHRLAGIAHMPFYERAPTAFRHYHVVYGVSQHVIDSLRSHGLENIAATPLYGVADLSARGRGGSVIKPGSTYDWDPRKPRDRFFGLFDPIRRLLRPATPFTRLPGLSLGLVSRLTPIKQFPEMFSILAPVLAAFPSVNLEIFGSGGYASVRDLRAEFAPLGRRVRWWGYQADVRNVYPLLDYTLSGLPEKEALGLNLIESQACNVPVLAVNAPPFTETVVHGETGFLYADPRIDAGSDFKELVASLVAGRPRPAPLRAAGHLARFSEMAFRRRIEAVLEELSLNL